MRIALDYDGTFTEDRYMWTALVKIMLDSGHEVSFVTFRDETSLIDNQDIVEDARICGIPIVFTAGEQKARCFKADIWIDDHPELIPNVNQAAFYALCLERDNEQTSISSALAARGNQSNQRA